MDIPGLVMTVTVCEVEHGHLASSWVVPVKIVDLSILMQPFTGGSLPYNP